MPPLCGVCSRACLFPLSPSSSLSLLNLRLFLALRPDSRPCPSSLAPASASAMILALLVQLPGQLSFWRGAACFSLCACQPIVWLSQEGPVLEGGEARGTCKAMGLGWTLSSRTRWWLLSCWARGRCWQDGSFCSCCAWGPQEAQDRGQLRAPKPDTSGPRGPEHRMGWWGRR